MADEGEVDVLGDFDFKLEVDSGMYDTNELPSKSANLLPEYTNPPWMLDQSWPLDNCIDEKSKATIEKMLMEEQYYINGKTSRSKHRLHAAGSQTQVSAKTTTISKKMTKEDGRKSGWTLDEKEMFNRGLEIFGRSWTKIAELIPSKTSVQIKNYAHMLFWKQKKETSQSETNVDCDKVVSKPKATRDPIAETMARVSTASTTVTTRTPILPKKGRIPNAEKEKSIFKKNINNPKPSKSSSPNKKKVQTLKSKSQKVKRLNDGKKKEQKRTTMSNGVLQKWNHVLPPVPVHSLSTVNLSHRVLDHNMTITPALIENLDGFCAVADIIAGGNDDTEDVDIDIENEDENDLNPVLQCRSTSPNSIYEKLLSEANLKIDDNLYNDRTSVELKADDSSTIIKEDCEIETEEVSLLDTGIDVADEVAGQTEGEESVVTELSETRDMVGDGAGATHKHMVAEMEDKQDIKVIKTEPQSEDIVIPKVYMNAVVTNDGETIHFDIPTSEVHMDPTEITSQEHTVHKEFFDNRPFSLKTPQRYLKIRNYIIESWKKCKPVYLNKTSVRPGLKNCGDVNCIGRVHAYLECIGAINFGCEQTAYNTARITQPVYSKEKTNKDTITTEISLAKLDAMRPRKRKVKDPLGFWIDEKELQGKTIEHERLAKEAADKAEKEEKSSNKQPRSTYDPFKLIPCLPFSQDNQAPFLVEIHNSALIVMDIHSHISKTEVIGMLGGSYCEVQGKLTISMATPCNSISTGMQCEMDPVSQTQASEEIRGSGMLVVGWYHSHPTFSPNPSVRDIETQLKFQDWFSQGGSKFVGIIISPYNPRNMSLTSEINCLTISEDKLPLLQCNIPYKFQYTCIECDVSEISNIILTAQDLATSHMAYKNKVDLLSTYSTAWGITCLQKMLESLKTHYPDSGGLGLIENIRKAFTSEDFCASSDNSETASQKSLESRPDSTVTDSTVTDSTVMDSTITESTVTDSTIRDSTIRDSGVTESEAESLLYRYLQTTS